MTLGHEEISLAPNGEEFVLKRLKANGEILSIQLSPMNALHLPQLITKAVHAEIVKRMIIPKGSESLLAPIVTGFHVGSDLHGDSVLLTLKNEHGAEYSFSLTHELLGNLVKAVAEKAAPILSQPKPTRQ